MCHKTEHIYSYVVIQPNTKSISIQGNVKLLLKFERFVLEKFLRQTVICCPVDETRQSQIPPSQSRVLVDVTAQAADKDSCTSFPPYERRLHGHTLHPVPPLFTNTETYIDLLHTKRNRKIIIQAIFNTKRLSVIAFQSTLSHSFQENDSNDNYSILNPHSLSLHTLLAPRAFVQLLACGL